MPLGESFVFEYFCLSVKSCRPTEDSDSVSDSEEAIIQSI